MTGKGFPTTEAKFDEEIRKECFKELDKVDPDIYGVCTSSLFPPTPPFSLTT